MRLKCSAILSLHVYVFLNYLLFSTYLGLHLSLPYFLPLFYFQSFPFPHFFLTFLSLLFTFLCLPLFTCMFCPCILPMMFTSLLLWCLFLCCLFIVPYFLCCVPFICISLHQILAYSDLCDGSRKTFRPCFAHIFSFW